MCGDVRACVAAACKFTWMYVFECALCKGAPQHKLKSKLPFSCYIWDGKNCMQQLTDYKPWCHSMNLWPPPMQRPGSLVHDFAVNAALVPQKSQNGFGICMFKILCLQIQFSMSQMSKISRSCLAPNHFYLKGFHLTIMNFCAKRTVGYKWPKQCAFWFPLVLCCDCVWIQGRGCIYFWTIYWSATASWPLWQVNIGAAHTGSADAKAK